MVIPPPGGGVSSGYGWGPPPPAAAAPPPPPPPPARRRLVVVALAVVGAVLTLAAVGGLFIRVPYDTIAPGSARQVDDLIVVRDHPVYLAQGRVLFTTVSVREGINLWEVVGAWLDPDIDMVSEKDVRGTTPPDKYHELNVEAMADSKTAAEAVALRHLGFTGLDGGAQVVSVEPGLPASSVLAAKDVIVAVDGKPVTGPSGLVAAIGVHRPGDTLQLAVERDGAPAAERTATLATGDQGRPLLGVRLTTKLKLPFGVSIDSGNIEGPSAGLAYSLALLDRLTPGELTGGAKVAATGELGADGRVGAIGGVAQKVAAVRRSGATLFLVPRENYAEAEAHAGSHLRVAAIDTFDDALRAMGSLPGSNAASFAQAGGQGP